MRPIDHLAFGDFASLSFGKQNFNMLRSDAYRSVWADLVQVHDPEVRIVDEPFSDCITHVPAQFLQRQKGKELGFICTWTTSQLSEDVQSRPLPGVVLN